MAGAAWPLHYSGGGGAHTRHPTSYPPQNNSMADLISHALADLTQGGGLRNLWHTKNVSHHQYLVCLTECSPSYSQLQPAHSPYTIYSQPLPAQSLNTMLEAVPHPHVTHQQP